MRYRRVVQTTDKAIARGALVNVLGSVGKILVPVNFIVLTRLYGPENAGLFYLVFSILAVAASLTVSGITEGLIMFLSRDIDDTAKQENLYRVLANGVVFCSVMAVVVVIFCLLGGMEAISSKYSRAGVTEAVRLLVWSLPVLFIPMLVTAATKSLMIMKWDAILLGFLQPITMMIFSVSFYFISPELPSMLWGYLLSNVVVTVASLYVFGMYFSYGKLFRHLREFRPFVPLITFAVPQNLNITFSTFVNNVDIFLLGYFGFAPEKIAFYGFGTQIVRNIRQVKLAFSYAFAPVIARLHAQGNHQEMNRSFSMISRWTSTIGFPLALIVAVYRNELILLFHPSFTDDTMFMLVLLVPPLISLTIGLSANILVMTGHSGWNMVNSVSATFLITGMNYYLIQEHGLIGAATGTACGTLFVTLWILVEIKLLEKVQLILREIYKPYVAILPPILLMVFTSYAGWTDAPLSKAALMVAALVVYLGMVWGLGLEEEDKKVFFRGRARSQTPDV